MSKMIYFLLFIKNDKVVLSAIENISDKHINKLKNNDFTQHILCLWRA